MTLVSRRWVEGEEIGKVFLYGFSGGGRGDVFSGFDL